MRASEEREGEREERGALRGLTDTRVNKLLYFKHWKIPINFKVNALLYSEWWKSALMLVQTHYSDIFRLTLGLSLSNLLYVVKCQNLSDSALSCRIIIFWTFFNTVACDYVGACVLDSTLRP